MKKLSSILLAVLMVFSLGLTAFAATATDPQPTIDIAISPVEDYNTVALYQIASITEMNTNVGEDDNKTYNKYAIAAEFKTIIMAVINKNDEVLAADASDADVMLYITNNSSAELTKAIAGALVEAVTAEDSTIAADYDAGSDEFSNGTITLSGIAMGYYLILDTTDYETAGVQVITNNPILAVADEDLSISLKLGTYTTITKTADKASYNIGDTVTYTSEVYIPYFDFIKYDAKTVEFVVRDTMGTGLDYVEITSIKDGDTVLTNGTDITYVENNTDEAYDFILTFGDATDDDETVGGLVDFQGKTLTITYTATVNNDAPTDTTGLINDIEAGYGEEDYVGAREVVYSYGIDIIKTNEYDEVLAGVEFELYTADPYANEDAVALTFTEVTADTDGSYLFDADSTNTTLVTDADGKLLLFGLEEGTYYLKETKGLDGYTALTEAVVIAIADKVDTDVYTGIVNDADGEDAYYDLGIINYTSINLPETGGIGTTIFTVSGIVIMLGAAIAFVVYKKKTAKK